MRNIFMAGTPVESLGQSWMKTGWGWIVPENGGSRRGAGWAQSGWGIPIPAPAPEEVTSPPQPVGYARVLFGRDRMGLPLGPTAPAVTPQQEPVMVDKKTGNIIPGLMGKNLSGISRKGATMQGNFFMGQGIAQTFGGGYIYPTGQIQSAASPYGQFGQGFPGGAYLQAPVAQAVPVVEGAVMYTQQVRYPKQGGNPNWPFQGPRGGQMWLQ